LQRFPREWNRLVAHRAIDVRTIREGLSPARHRAIGIEHRRSLERTYGFLVVEVEKQHHPLVKITLGLRRLRRNLVMMAADAVE
jgi:hypothetical protein